MGRPRIWEVPCRTQALISRLDSGHWADVTDPSVLNAYASSLGALNVAPASFIPFEPAQFLRPFNSSTH